MMPPSLNLVVLRSLFPERSRAFYESLLALPFEHHTDHGTPHYAATLGTVTLELYPTMSTVLVYDSVGFVVESIAAAIARVGEQHLYRPAAPSKFGLVAMLRDPDGRLVFLTEKGV